MNVTYFGSDLTDPAAVRRIHVLRAAGVDVKVIGFRRSPTPVETVEGLPAVDLGRTFNGRLGHRCLQVLLGCLQAKKLRQMVTDADLLMGRNLEMVTMAYVARLWAGSNVPLAYECLDIHRAFIGKGLTARLLRIWERQILRKCATLVLSSPGHLTNYFGKLGIGLPNLVLAENKRVLPVDGLPRPQANKERKPPWRIGWFGQLRCTESFRILFRLAQAYPDLVEIDLRGRPIDTVQAMIDRHLPVPNMRFHGPYSQADLARIYEACDLAWGIEYFGAGSNSDWCLANRIYEGGFSNRPVIALAGTETAAWLQARNVGVILHDPPADLGPFIAGLTPMEYSLMWHACAAVPTGDLVWTLEDSIEFAARIAGRAQHRHEPGLELAQA